jgi:aspartate dehydrogenase
MSQPIRIGIIGFGQIGSYVYESIQASESAEVVWVEDCDTHRLETLPPGIGHSHLSRTKTGDVDLVCEMAHASVVRDIGANVLKRSDLFVLSVTALADQTLEDQLRTVATTNGTRLFVPHGGVMGLDALIDGKDMWDSVEIKMIKNPANLDFTASGIDPESLGQVTSLYDGPTRGVCAQFPRNVNTHATIALAGIGFERTRSILIADRSTNQATLTITVRADGVQMSMTRSETITGVTGATTSWSVLGSIRALMARAPGLHFC